jgi:hypothetical protein
MCDMPPASDDTPTSGLARHTLSVDEQCDPGDGGVDLEGPVDQVASHARPLSKRKAKKARRKLARQHTAQLQKTGAGFTSAVVELCAASNRIGDVWSG